MAEDRPVLDQLNLVVRDMDAMAAFYTRLGVEIPSRDPMWAPHHRSAVVTDGMDLDLDSTAFAARWDEGWPSGRVGVVIGFRLPSREAVDATYADLTSAGYAGQQRPYDAFWGARYAVVVDPDGNAVGLMSPIDPETRSTPPTPSAW